MKNIEKALKEELRNNDCIEDLVNNIDAKKSIYDAFVVDGKLVIVFDNELQTNEVEDIQSQLKKVKGCGEVFNDEFELGYKGNFKSVTLNLLTDNISIGKFEYGGQVNKISSIELETIDIDDVDFQKYLKDNSISYKVSYKPKSYDFGKGDYITYFGSEKSLKNMIDNHFAGTKEDSLNIYKSIQYAKGGEIKVQSDFRGVDMFDHWQEIKEPKLRKFLNKLFDAYGSNNEPDKKFLKQRLVEANQMGYTFEIDEYDDTVYGLRPIGIEYDDLYAKGGEMAKRGQMNKLSQRTQVKRNLKNSGAFTLEMEMAVYVPSTTFADQIISKTLFQKRIQEVEKYLSKLFGGYSSTSVEGGYVSKEKGLIKEDVAKVTAFGTEESLKKNFKPLMRQISKWCEAWGQESMGFEFEGDLYYVSKDAKFSKGGKIDKRPKFVKNGKK
jgi:hypothetical protein